MSQECLIARPKDKMNSIKCSDSTINALGTSGSKFKVAGSLYFCLHVHARFLKYFTDHQTHLLCMFQAICVLETKRISTTQLTFKNCNLHSYIDQTIFLQYHNCQAPVVKHEKGTDMSSACTFVIQGPVNNEISESGVILSIGVKHEASENSEICTGVKHETNERNENCTGLKQETNERSEIFTGVIPETNENSEVCTGVNCETNEHRTGAKYETSKTSATTFAGVEFSVVVKTEPGTDTTQKDTTMFLVTEKTDVGKTDASKTNWSENSTNVENPNKKYNEDLVEKVQNLENGLAKDAARCELKFENTRDKGNSHKV